MTKRLTYLLSKSLLRWRHSCRLHFI